MLAAECGQAFPVPMPQLTLSRKIFLALAALLIVLLISFAGLSIIALQRGLGAYVAEIEIRRMDWLSQLVLKNYVANGDWKNLRDNEDAWQRLQMGRFASVLDSAAANGDERRLPPWYEYRAMRAAPPPDAPDGGPMPGMPPSSAQLDLLPRRAAGMPGMPPPWVFPDPRGMHDSIFQRLAVLDVHGARVVGADIDLPNAARLPIRHNKSVIGYLALAPMQGLESEADRAFVAQQSGVIVLTGLCGLGFALVLSWLLARRWFRPIDELTQAAQDVARGRLSTRVAVQGSDELALLGKTFNDMAQRLDTVEASRRAWLADAAHELRTPLAAMRAEIEALQDGVRTFDERTALRLHRQVIRLGQLVDDLRSSMREPQSDPLAATVYPLSLLKEALDHTRDRFARRGISVDRIAVDRIDTLSQPTVEGDAHRLHQVFMNLLENTLAYTDEGGAVRIDVTVEGPWTGNCLTLLFEDSTPGVPEHELPRLFDRLFRGEGSRSREHGGSGLGLSICRATIEAHGGTIDASASPLGGLRVTITLPLAAQS
ncbi:Signal transduction histidine-protein kinase BaeS [Variovorax paradoxus]|uniref:Signal transduction histidine-protein kinase/phosphatase MprB n=2 Tax=Variovorax paradoxus TaxID=34073 RepID=A0A679JLB7_VARPD|nr:Signal transduction histidine-protein kinase BaeS [Variovorax paradoxus]